MSESRYITVKVKSVYGNDLVYPDDDTARAFAKLLRVKTFNTHQIAGIKVLGYAIHVNNGPLPFDMALTRF
jgi:hypothetical protein